MRYAHLADLHLGSWRDPKMRDLSTQAFLKAADECVSKQVDFILFSGDMFNTSLPSLDTLKIVTKRLKQLQEKNIPIYAIAGSHDFSPSGKTMLDVLENAGLLVNVCKGNVDEQQRLHLRFTVEPKTGAKITGMLGKKGLLDRVYYQNLCLEELEQEPGYKIFMFHTTLSELKPKHLEKMESQPLSFLPKHFNYYAGGHVHHPAQLDQPEYGVLTYPGALFPNNFAELEQYSGGGFYFIEFDGLQKSEKEQKDQQKLHWCPLQIKPHLKLVLDCNHKTPQQVTIEIQEFFHNKNVQDALITMRLTHTLAAGKSSDIDFKSIFEELYSREAFYVMKNTAQLESEEFEEISLAEIDPQQVEERLIAEHLQQSSVFDKERESQLIRELLMALNTCKREGETVADFNSRIESEISKLINN